MSSSCAVSVSVALATEGDTGSASSARVFHLLMFTLGRLATPRPVTLGASAQMHGVGVPTSHSQLHLHVPTT